jgi:hypothetical protein
MEVRGSPVWPGRDHNPRRGSVRELPNRSGGGGVLARPASAGAESAAEPMEAGRVRVGIRPRGCNSHAVGIETSRQCARTFHHLRGVAPAGPGVAGSHGSPAGRGHFGPTTEKADTTQSCRA